MQPESLVRYINDHDQISENSEWDGFIYILIYCDDRVCSVCTLLVRPGRVIPKTIAYSMCVYILSQRVPFRLCDATTHLEHNGQIKRRHTDFLVLILATYLSPFVFTHLGT